MERSVEVAVLSGSVSIMIVITQLPSTAEEINTELNTLRDFYIKKSKVYDFASAKVVNNLIFNYRNLSVVTLNISPNIPMGFLRCTPKNLSAISSSI